MAKDLLSAKGIEYKEVNAEESIEEFTSLAMKHNHRTVPMIFINDTFVGGFDQLKALNDSGKLDETVAK